MGNQNNDYIYEKIVEDEHDIIGMIAYSFYKKEKIEYIKTHKKTKNEEEPTKEELLKFQKLKIDKINNYRKLSEEKYTKFINDILKTEREEIEDKLTKYEKNKKDLEEKEKELETRNKLCKAEPKSFWYGVFQSFIATLIYIILCIIIIIYKKYGDILTWFRL